ncbi:oligosaccharide flippase family protein, partial [Parapusillimonas sp. SGNA-6]|nr:oligosaccharide flippase family protein [Parapusillimonas sp. SGNA-6]
TFYDKEIITNLIRVYGVTVIIQAFVQVQSVYLVKNLQFKKQALMKLPSIVISSIIAIYMAYSGYGVWSLVFMYLLQSFFWALFHWIFGKWNPTVDFHMKIFNKHFGYGYRMTLIELMNNITANVYQILIGKFYNSSSVGYYTQSLTLRQVPMTNVYGAMIKVLFPIFAEIQESRKKFVMYFYKCQELIMITLFPIFIFLIFNAEEIFIVLFSEKWRAASIYLQVLSLAGILNVLVNWNLAIIKIISDSKRILKVEIILKFTLFFLIVLALIRKDDINYLLVTIPVFPLISYVIYSSIVSRLLGEKFWRNIKDVLYSLGISIVPAFFLYLNSQLVKVEGYLTLLLAAKVLLYFSIYMLFVYIFKKPLVILLKS